MVADAGTADAGGDAGMSVGDAGHDVACDAGFIACGSRCVGPGSAFVWTVFDGGAPASVVLSAGGHNGSRNTIVTFGGNEGRAYQVSDAGEVTLVANISVGQVIEAREFRFAPDALVSVITTSGSGDIKLIRFDPRDGGATFGPHQALGVTYGLGLADFTSDGLTDVVVTNVFADRVTVFPNEGDGGLGRGVSTSAGFNPIMLAVGVLSSSPRVDLAILSSGIDRTSVAISMGDGGFAVTNYTFGATPRRLFIADVTGDGLNDVLAYVDGDGTLRVRAGTMTGTLGAVSTLSTLGAGLISVRAVDLNGDGVADIVGAAPAAASAATAWGKPDGGFIRGPALPIPFVAQTLETDDVDGDGVAEVLVTSSQGEVAIGRSQCR